MFRYQTFLTLAAVCCVAPGCASSRQSIVSNPVFVPAQDREFAWERTVDVLHAYQFPIERESQLEGVIETGYKVGSGVLEPWHRDSDGFDERLESSLQSIRRRVVVNVIPAEGGHLIGVEAFKEREDLPPTANPTSGTASFHTGSSLDPTAVPVGGIVRPAGWIPLGRDSSLEQSLLHSLRASFGGQNSMLRPSPPRF